jgi:hypothetical protein
MTALEIVLTATAGALLAAYLTAGHLHLAEIAFIVFAGLFA